MKNNDIVAYFTTTDFSQICWLNQNREPQLGKLSDLADIAGNAEIWLIAPALDVVICQATLPKLSKSKLLAALPYALEEQLIEDVNNLHFAIGEYQEHGQLPVAIVSKKKLEHWIDLLRRQGLQLAGIIPAPLALPNHTHEWHIFIENDTAIIRNDIYQGISIDRANLETILNLEMTETKNKPERIKIFNFSKQPNSIKLAQVKVKETMYPSESFITHLSLSNHATLNLLQGNYRPKVKSSLALNYWRLAGYATATWLSLALISNLVSFGILYHAQNNLEKQINIIYKENFPQAESIILPKERMTEKLHALLTQDSKNPFLLWLGILAKNVKNTPDIHILQISYLNNVLTLELSASNFGMVDKLSHDLIAQGLAVKQQNMMAQNNQIKGRLLISGGKYS
jgi:general secretion pathway protein L